MMNYETLNTIKKALESGDPVAFLNKVALSNLDTNKLDQVHLSISEHSGYLMEILDNMCYDCYLVDSFYNDYGKVFKFVRAGHLLVLYVDWSANRDYYDVNIEFVPEGESQRIQTSVFFKKNDYDIEKAGFDLRTTMAWRYIEREIKETTIDELMKNVMW